TYSTFGVHHVWASSDGGATWKSSDEGLPDVPFHSVVVDPSGRIYAGSDVGVFVSLDNGAHWAVENTGFANVVTQQLLMSGSYRDAFPHGRGAGGVALPPPQPPPAVSIADATAFEGNAGTYRDLTFTASLDAATRNPVSVQYATAGGTATSGSDYIATSG